MFSSHRPRRHSRSLVGALLLLLALSIGAGSAQPATTVTGPVSGVDSGTVSGIVTDPTRAPLANAVVKLVGETSEAASRSTVTDADGRFRFEAVAAGDHSLLVTFPGFETGERQVTVGPQPVTADISLRIGVREIIDVTDDLAKAEAEAHRAATPGGVTVIDTADLYRQHTSGLADLLRYVPGVWAESASGSEELFFSSRGSNLDSVNYDKNGVKLLQDGLPVTTADGNNHNRVIDPLSASYASVARGANGQTYGASTLGGAIDFTSPTARNSAPLSLFLNGGSNGAADARATVGSGAREGIDGLLTLDAKQWDGYRDHSDQERWGIYANGGWRPSETVDVRGFATYVHNDQNLPGALTLDEVAENPDQASDAALSGNYGKVVETARLAAKSTWTLGADRLLQAGLSYEEQSLFHPIVDRIFVDFDGPGPAPPVEVFSLLVDTDHRDLGAVFRYDQSAGRHNLAAGLNYGRGSVDGGNYRNLNGQANGISETVDNEADNTEAFLSDNWRAADRVTVVIGAQYVNAMRDVLTTNADTGTVSHPSDRYTALNPRVGVIASLQQSGEVYGNVSRLFEAPTTFQMEDDVRGGNATLDAMTGTVAEIGWRSREGSSAGTWWTWDLSAYYAGITNEILSVDDPNAPGNSLTTNVDSTVHAGFEGLLTALVPVGRGSRIVPKLSLSLNHFVFDDDPVWGNNDLPGAPAYAVRGEVLFRHHGGFYGGPTFDLVDERFADFANTYQVDGYALLGLRAGYATDRWDVFLDIRNLLDQEYIGAVNVLDQARPDARVLYPGTPLSAYVGWRWSL